MMGGDIYDGIGHLCSFLIIAIIAAIILAIVCPEDRINENSEEEAMPVPVVEYWGEDGQKIPDSEIGKIYKGEDGAYHLDLIVDVDGEPTIKTIVVLMTVRDMTEADLSPVAE